MNANNAVEEKQKGRIAVPTVMVYWNDSHR